MTSEAERSPTVDPVSNSVKRQALTAAPIGAIIVDRLTDGNPIVYTNDAFRRLTGYTAAEARGRSVQFLWGEETDPDATAEIRGAIETGESASVVFEGHRKDGTTLWTRLELAPLTNDGTVTHMVGYQHDVTELKERERRATERQRRFEAFHDAGRELRGATSHADVARIVADTVTHALGFPTATVQFVDEDAERLRTVDDDGPTVPVDGDTPAARAYRTGEPLRDGDAGMYLPIGEYGVLGVRTSEREVFDDTDRELVDVLAKLAAGAVSQLDSERTSQRRNERLERFADIVAHDLRNPLNIARGRLELAQQHIESDELDAVADAHERMSVLIDHLLALARERKSMTDAETLALETVAREGWQHVETPNARLRTDASCTIQADECGFKRLLENLFRNSVEHGSTNAQNDADATLTVTIGTLDDGFYVEDDGVGIPAQERDRVLDDGYSTAADGTGFGLSIVEMVADAHDWSLRVTESEDGGARFEFTGVTAA